MGRPLGGPGVLEGRMSDYLVDWFRDLGITCERQPVSPGRENVLARYEAPGATTTILFDAHQDTVPTDGMTIPPFLPTVEGGRLHGRGSCDIKGGMAAMLVAFARLVRERPRGSASLLMACTVDEEFTHTGASRLAAHWHGASLAVVAEPTLLDLVDRHKGAVRWKARARGIACHSSTPHLGANAIYRMGRVLQVLADYAQSLRDATPDPVLGSPTLSVGRIEGGQSVNVVPDWCEIEIDRRLVPGETFEDASQRVWSALEERLGSLDWLEFLPPWVNMPPLAPNRASSEIWLPRLVNAVSKATGRTPQIAGVPYGTDAGPLGATGLPCVVFGPGDIAQAHTKDEWVELDQVRAASEAYYQMVCDLGDAG
ncbi:MAG: M20 family metallopeptidase [Isosphaeraceae bacterium]|nr:M20 family metallopeptidase [Isosphaeraceae bacterium]